MEYPAVPAEYVAYCKRHWPQQATQVDFDGVTYSWNPKDHAEKTA